MGRAVKMKIARVPSPESISIYFWYGGIGSKFFPFRVDPYLGRTAEMKIARVPSPEGISIYFWYGRIGIHQGTFVDFI